jgi:hypothetical protein
LISPCMVASVKLRHKLHSKVLTIIKSPNANILVNRF